MSTQVINGVLYQEEDIPGKGLCWIPKNRFTLADIEPGNKFVFGRGSVAIVIQTFQYPATYLLGGFAGNPSRCWSIGGKVSPVTKQDILDYMNNSTSNIELIRYEN